MSKIKYDDIQDLNQSWEYFSGQSVERFVKKELKNRCGYIYRSRTKEGDYYYLYGFTDYEQYEAWAEGDSTITPLFKVQLPNVENDTFTANLTTNSNTSKIVNLGEGVIIGLKYSSVSTNPTTHISVDTGNDGTLIISRSANGSSFAEVGRVVIQSIPEAESRFYNFDLTPYLVDGENKIRLRVEDNVNGSISSNLTFQSVINTTLAVENATSTSAPLRALQFQYYIQGQVSKTLHLNITQGAVNQTFNFPIGDSTYIEVPYTTPLINLELESGIVQVDAWLSVDDTELVSYHEVNQFYYTDASSINTIIILNNVNTNIVNYTNEHLFDMVLYNQGADVEVSITSNDGNTEFLTLNYNDCQTGVVYPVYATLEVDSQSNNISAMVSVSCSSFSCTPYSVNIDNTEKMSPVEGATFVLNPKVRNNSESNPNTIINSVSGRNVNSTFTGFGFLNDGWVSDSDNIGVLRIPSNHSLVIDYDVLDNLTHGTSIELDYKVYNIFNDNDEVIKMYTTNENQQVLGFVMNATEAAFYTSENQTKRDQDVIFQEGVRTHMVVNIVPNLSNSGLNYIRIFVNGILNREMLYSGTDVFKSGTVSMQFGSQNCDIDIYGIRVYKSGLSASDIRQNYMSSLPNIESKIAFKQANNILSANGTISFDKAKEKYNTLVWTGTVPSYSTGNRSYAGELEINIIGDAEHSGKISNLQIKGQGSSSRGYWKWNHQYDFNKLDGLTTVWTDGNDVEHTDGYSLTSTDPAATKLVAKLNWASSMQSHKLGSTAMYTDLWKQIVGGNGITNTQGYENVRVSVHEKPFLYFVKESENAQPVFYGLMTFGSAKYDKPTFGYDKNVFPDYLILEGSDNGMPLTLRQVPWIADEVVYNDEEEYYEYAGQGNLDYGMGKQANITYFMDAFNFTYLHSPFLVSFTGSIPANADKKNQYWDTATMNVYRYDYISQDWVDAGITKADDEYNVLNLEVQTGLYRSNYDSDLAYQNAVINWRKNDFKNRISTYYNVNDVLYSMAFLKLIGASDNWCKNTYEYLDPVSHKICLAQDDMDTLMLTDNVGRKTKPYYVEEHDLDNQSKPYFNGSDNVFFNLMEMAFDAEEKNMMKQILTAMENTYDSVKNCLQHYFFNVQEYFPAVAYNETARLLYEEASVQQSTGAYVNGTPAISQSLGDQLQAERQWWNRRIPYMQSWSSSNPFYTRSTTEPNLQFRSMTTINNTNPNYSFSLTPWQYLYPKVGTGQFLSYDNTRVPARTVYSTVNMSTDGNTDTFIYGSNYYTSFGEFGGVSLSETFNLVGDRLLGFSADSREVAQYNFRPTRMTVACPELRTFCVYGCSTLAGSLDLSNSKKLQSVDLRGTNLSAVILPQTEKLTTAYLPNLTSLTIVNLPNLSNLSIAGYSNLVNITTDRTDLAMLALTNAANLGSVNLYGVNITTNNSNVNTILSILANPAVECNITGTIYLAKNLSYAEKAALEDKFGSAAFYEGADLYISYVETDIQSITLTPSINTYSSHDEGYIDVSYIGNNDLSYSWTINSTNPLTVSRTKNRLSIIAGELTSAETVQITYTITKKNGTTVSQSCTIMLMPYTFYLNGTAFGNNPEIELIYGSGDSSITDSTGWAITCSDENAEFTVNSVSVSGGSAVVSENSISSITKSTLNDGTLYSCYVIIGVDGLTFQYNFGVRTELLSMTINDIGDITALSGSGSGNISFNHTSGYTSKFTVVSASVNGNNTNTVSNLTLNGCTISVSGYTETASRVLTLVYKVNGGADCTATKSFNVVFVGLTPKVKVVYDVQSASSATQVLNNGVSLSNVNSMKVDDTAITPTKTYTFASTGAHTVEYEFSYSFDLRDAFNGITTIVSAEIADIKTIGQSAFQGCTNLATLVLKDGIESISNYTFGSCSSLSDITSESFVAPNWEIYAFSNIPTTGWLTYPTGSDYSSWFEWYRFSGWNTFEINNIIYSVRHDGVYVEAKSGNSTPNTINFGDVVIPSSVQYNGKTFVPTKIKDSGFSGCINLTSMTLPNTITTIGQGAFATTRMNTINIPASVVSLPNYWLSTYYVGASITEVLVSVDSNNPVYNDGNGSGCIIETATNTLIFGNTRSTIPSSVRHISSYAFNENHILVNLVIPEGVETIANLAFNFCDSMETLVLPSTITSIGIGNFGGYKLHSITINKSTAPTISPYSFSYDSDGDGDVDFDDQSAGYASMEYGFTNVLYVPQGATGYNGSAWTELLVNPNYSNFTISYTLPTNN